MSINTELGDQIMWVYNHCFFMLSIHSVDEDEKGRSKIVTKMVDGNTVIVDKIKFEDTQTQFASIEIMIDEQSGFIKFNMILPCNTSNDLELDILKRINTFNNKCKEAAVFYNTEKQKYEYQSSIGFAGYTDDYTDDPKEAISFKNCRDQACINWMLGSLGVARSWLGFISNE